MQSKAFIITKEQIEKIRSFMPEIDDLMQNYSKFENALDDAIIGELEFRDDEYWDTPNSIMLQKIYDEIYRQNAD
nr:MAG TPA: hypothetical protein [Caudoviricetes sp.]